MADLQTAPASANALEDRIATFRRFTRFYTRQMGWLHRGILDTPFTMTEGRVLYEIAHREPTTASALVADLGVDHGHLSRMLRRFEENGLVRRITAREDGRQRLLRLTPKGRRAFDVLNQGSRDQVAGLLGPLQPRDQARVVAAMASVESMLSQAPADRAAGLVLRPHQPGDMGWVVSINGALYAQEYGWDVSYEALVARITADFIENLDPARERCWIAELDGERVGSVFLVRKSDTVAQLRLLIVDPKARGLGLGTRLVTECLAFAKAAGYDTMTLWTQSILTAARAIYARAGFERVSEAPHHSFGVDLVGEIWERALRAKGPADEAAR